jgi:hypothetical protein
MTSAHFFTVLLTLLLVAACSKQKGQHISVVVTRGGSPAAGVEVRLYSQENCQGSFGGKTPGSSGWLEFNRLGGRGDDHPVTDQISVCVQVQGVWQPLLSTSQGADPKVIDLKCEIAGPEPRCITKFDGRLLQERAPSAQ